MMIMTAISKGMVWYGLGHASSTLNGRGGEGEREVRMGQ